MSNIAFAFNFLLRGLAAVDIFLRKVVNKGILPEYVDYYERVPRNKDLLWGLKFENENIKKWINQNCAVRPLDAL